MQRLVGGKSQAHLGYEQNLAAVLFSELEARVVVTEENVTIILWRSSVAYSGWMSAGLTRRSRKRPLTNTAGDLKANSKTNERAR